MNNFLVQVCVVSTNKYKCIAVCPYQYTFLFARRLAL